MPTFKYTARDRVGHQTSGVVQANDPDELRRILRANDLFLVRQRGDSRSTVQQASSQLASIFDPRPKLQDMTIAVRQLATMIRSGVPIVEAIQIVGQQSNKPALQRAMKDVEDAVTEGHKMSSAMRRHPRLFNPLLLALVEAGETAGTLEQTLEVAAEQLDREDELRRRIKAAVFYPKLVFAVACGTVAVMLFLVVPVFANVYRDLRTELPFATRLLINTSDALLSYWWLAILLMVVGYFGFVKFRETPFGNRQVDIVGLKLPVIGPLSRKIAIARFVQTLAGALKGGVSVLRSLVISGETAGNVIIRDAVIESAQAIRSGSTMAEELEKTGEFPLMVTKMIYAGEASGNIDEMLSEINRFYDRDVQYAVDQLTRLIEPILTIAIGAIVLLVLLALYMPIFKLGEAFQKAN